MEIKVRRSGSCYFEVAVEDNNTRIVAVLLDSQERDVLARSLLEAARDLSANVIDEIRADAAQRCADIARMRAEKIPSAMQDAICELRKIAAAIVAEFEISDYVIGVDFAAPDAKDYTVRQEITNGREKK